MKVTRRRRRKSAHPRKVGGFIVAGRIGNRTVYVKAHNVKAHKRRAHRRKWPKLRLKHIK